MWYFVINLKEAKHVIYLDEGENNIKFSFKDVLNCNRLSFQLSFALAQKAISCEGFVPQMKIWDFSWLSIKKDTLGGRSGRSEDFRAQSAPAIEVRCPKLYFSVMRYT